MCMGMGFFVGIAEYDSYGRPMGIMGVQKYFSENANVNGNVFYTLE